MTPEEDHNANSQASGLLAGMPPELRASLLALYVDDTAERMTQMIGLLEVGDLERVSREAHAVKAGSLQVGENEVANLAQELRHAIDAGDPAGIRRGHTELVEAFARARERLS